MNAKLTLGTVAIVAALSLAVVPASAQGRGDSGRQRGGGGARAAQAAPRDSGRQAVPRGGEGRQYSGGPAVNRGGEARQSGSGRLSGGPAVNRGGEARQSGAGRLSGGPAVNRGGEARQSGGGQFSGGQAVNRGGQNRQYSGGGYSGGQAVNRGFGGGQVERRAVPRTNDRFQSPGFRDGGRPGYAQPRGGSGRFDSRRYVRPSHFEPYRPFYFSRPYYSFRARLDFGFGLWLGISVPYPWSYYGGYRPRLYGYGYYNPGGSYYYAQQGMGAFGGLSFEIQPSDADLFVDGEYVGPVGSFTPYGEPLTLMAGVHRIAIVREGYQTMEWDVTVEPGMVLPYRGMLVPW